MAHFTRLDYHTFITENSGMCRVCARRALCVLALSHRTQTFRDRDSTLPYWRRRPSHDYHGMTISALQRQYANDSAAIAECMRTGSLGPLVTVAYRYSLECARRTQIPLLFVMNS